MPYHSPRPHLFFTFFFFFCLSSSPSTPTRVWPSPPCTRHAPGTLHTCCVAHECVVCRRPRRVGGLQAYAECAVCCTRCSNAVQTEYYCGRCALHAAWCGDQHIAHPAQSLAHALSAGRHTRDKHSTRKESSSSIMCVRVHGVECSRWRDGPRRVGVDFKIGRHWRSA